MNKDALIGVGVGLIIGWLLWRRRGLAGLMGAGGCGGCGGGTRANGGPGGCGQAVIAGTGNFAQGAGPTLQGAP